MNKTQLYNDQIFTVDDFISSEKCKGIIHKCNTKGWNKSSPSGGGHGRTGNEDPRTNMFRVLHDTEMSSDLWDKIKSHLPEDLSFIPQNVYFNSITR